MKNLFITGLNGRTGKYFLEELNNNVHDYNLYASVRRNVNFPNNVKKVNVDLDNFDEVLHATKNMDVIFHIAGIKKSINVVKAAIKNNVNWVILVHTTGIYSKYKSASKEYIEIEEEIKKVTLDKEIKITIIRPTMIFGSLDDNNMCVFIKMIDKLKLFPIVNGAKYFLQPIHQKDLGKAYFQLLMNEEKTKGKNYDLSGEKPIELIEILNIIAYNLNRKPIFFSIPFFIAYSGALILYYLTFSKIDIREKVQRLVEPRAYSHKEASIDFGFNPNSFDFWIKDEVKNYINSKGK